jgi:hypothetical protein
MVVGDPHRSNQSIPSLTKIEFQRVSSRLVHGREH